MSHSPDITPPAHKLAYALFFAPRVYTLRWKGAKFEVPSGERRERCEYSAVAVGAGIKPGNERWRRLV